MSFTQARVSVPVTRSAWSVFLAFLKLGLLSFGGPIAHLGYFRVEFVERRRWIDEQAYADLVALCQFLPGPTSSQVGMALGTRQAGLYGALAAWLGFTLPSALLMIAFGYTSSWLGDASQAGWVHGLKIAAVAVVAHAVWGMGASLCPDRPRIALAIAATVALLAWQSSIAPSVVIAAGALLGLVLLPANSAPPPAPDITQRLGKTLARIAWVLFFALLVLLPLLAKLSHSHAVELADTFYRAGSLVFGGGHVVLPLLRAEVVPAGWISDNDFLAGYGAAQAMPGPLFTFAAYLGTVMQPPPNGIAGALLCLVAIFLPAVLLVVGALPYWDALHSRPAVRAAVKGVNATVVGILLAALFDPIWTTAVHTRGDFALALASFALLAFWKTPPVAVVALCAIGGKVLSL